MLILRLVIVFESIRVSLCNSLLLEKPTQTCKAFSKLIYRRSFLEGHCIKAFQKNIVKLIGKQLQWNYFLNSSCRSVLFQNGYFIEHCSTAHLDKDYSSFWKNVHSLTLFYIFLPCNGKYVEKKKKQTRCSMHQRSSTVWSDFSYGRKLSKNAIYSMSGIFC